MENENLKRIAQDEDLQEDFFITFSDEFAEDDEPSDKKFRRLYQAWRDCPEIVDNVLMTLCGWTMESLAAKTIE